MFGKTEGKTVWGLTPEQVTIEYGPAELQTLLRPHTGIHSVVIKPTLGHDHYRVDEVRRADQQWLSPWEATLPPGAKDRLPSWRSYPKHVDKQMKQGELLAMMVEVNGELAGYVTLGAVQRGALSQGILGYWIISRWAGKGVTSLAAAAVIDLVLGPLNLHRVEVNVRPENIPSLALCRKLGLREEGYRERYMNIGGKWADHVLFAVDQEMVANRSLVETAIRRQP